MWIASIAYTSYLAHHSSHNPVDYNYYQYVKHASL